MANTKPLYYNSFMENQGMTKTDLPVLDRNRETFETYALWRSLPIPILKTMNREQLRDKMGFDDDDILDLIAIPTQRDFAQKYDLGMDTLTQWNKKLRDRDPLFEAKGWAKGLAKNVIISMYNHALRKGNPLLFKLFFQVINDWEEKSVIKQTPADIEFFIDLIKKEVPQPIEAEATEVPKKINDSTKKGKKENKD